MEKHLRHRRPRPADRWRTVPRSGLFAAGSAVALSIWRAREGKKSDTFGSASWARIEAVERIGLLGPDGVVVGKLQDRYVWLWFGANPPLPEQAALAARASATERYDQFMETLGQRLAGGPGRDAHLARKEDDFQN